MRVLSLIALTGVAFTVPAGAVEPVPGAEVGRSADAIAASLTASGYNLTRYEGGPARIEAEAVRGVERVEFQVHPVTGRVVGLRQVGGRLYTEDPASQTVASPATQSSPGARHSPRASEAQIRAALAAQGYEVLKFEREGHEIEVYAMRDGRWWELELDPRSGRVIKREAHD